MSVYVVIPTSNISEIVYDTSTDTELANKKSLNSFHVLTVDELVDISRSLDCFT